MKELVRKLQGSLQRRGFVVGDLFGSSTDLWAFSIDFKDFELSVGIGPKHGSANDRWLAQTHMEDPGWLSSTRAKRKAELTRVALAVRDALVADLGARLIE